ncbi:protein MLP1-like protein [Cinnamomum micranthum f. kanehirae]|uniref:Protein MLP1-like protein n=1 Tax=Cinnamomum micranthum f. kanehirae TaxID=337451 RepID=A0A3S4PRB3_9MAGN|nr:protein MLP1-like protein [Cinnamomum micranthum f. kanehirae]
MVPKGWDRLLVSVISIETGKTVAKSSKAVVRNSNCQWTEALSESIWVSQEDASKELEECLFKFVVSTGSARSGILGEAVVNLTDYTSSKASVPVSLPLKKCNHGTILQVKIQCLSPKVKLREEKLLEDANSNQEEAHKEYDDMDTKSDASDIMFTGSIGSSSSNNLGGSHGTSHPGETGSRDMSFSASESHRSSDSGDGSMGRTFSPGNNVNGDSYNLIGRQDLAGSLNRAIDAGPVDGPHRSNQSSFNSRIAGSSTHLQNQWQEVTGQGPSHVLAPLSLRTTGPPKDFLEAAEDTIEELRGEAKMWERNAQKLKLDLELLRKDFSERSRHQADLDMELSAACTERDRFKLETEQLKSLLDESMEKQSAIENSITRAEDINQMQKELEDEIRFQKESNANLSLQLTKTQESNIELVSILQELEDTIEKQRLEIEKFSAQKAELSDTINIRNLHDDSGRLYDETSVRNAMVTEDLVSCELEDSSTNLHEPVGMGQSSLIVQLEESQESQRKMHSVVEMLEKSLEDKNHEIEQERSLRNQALLDIEAKWACKISEKEEEISKLELKVSEFFLTPGSENMDLSNGADLDLVKENEALRAKVQELERDCNELTEENLDLIFKIKELEKDTETRDPSLGFGSDEYQTNITACVSDSEICKLKSHVHQLEQKLKEMEMLGDGLVTGKIGSQTIDLQSKCTNLELELETFKDKACNLDVELCKTRLDLEEKELEFNGLQLQLESYHVKEINWENQISAASTKLESLEMELQSKISDHSKALAMSSSEIEACEACVLLKEEEIESLRHLQRELEAEVSSLQKDKAQLEENLDVAQRESKITSKCLDDVRQDLMVLTNSMDSHVNANKLLERKLMELESGKCELELHLSELEEENVHLTERISGLDSQSRYLRDEKESSRLALEHSESLVVDLQDKIQRMRTEVEMQKVELEQKLKEAEKRLAEVEEGSEYLKRTNTKLQATIESFIEECSSLQKMNDELRRQRLKLNEQCTHLETELRESRKGFSDCSKQVELLEEKISSIHRDVIIKEKSLTSELESLFHKHKESEEKLLLSENLLNQEHLEKLVEIENLKSEIAHLTVQILSTHDERERMASEAVLELSRLRADKTKLENSLKDCHAQVKLLENELCTLRLESENKAQELTDMLAASRRNEEMLMVEHERMNRLVQDVKTGEEKLGVMLNETELKVKASEYERQLLTEEIASLKAQLQNLVNLQGEILELKSSLDEAKYEKGRLESSLKLLSVECEDMKAERVSFVEKFSSMQKALSEGEECRRSKIALEEKLLRLEGDLSAKEALCTQEAGLKNELGRIKRINSQYQRRIQCLEEEKDECLRRSQALEEELKLMKEDKHLKEKQLPEYSICNDILIQGQEVLEKDIKKNDNQRENKGSLLSTKIERGEEHPNTQLLDVNENQREVENKIHDHKERSQIIVGSDLISKIQLLETELAEALEANNMYKSQLKRYLSTNDNIHGNDLNKSAAGDGLRNKDGDFHGNDFNKSAAGDGLRNKDGDRNVSLLEAELKEMRERYFHMSLRYAEVEAQREELVMKVKSMKIGKRWFSIS